MLVAKVAIMSRMTAFKWLIFLVYAVIDKIENRRKKTPVITLSGHVFLKYGLKNLNVADRVYLVIAVKRAELLAIIEKYVL